MAFKFELEWRIGRYPIEREIGRGATSRVYAARDPATGRELAIKVFFNDESTDETGTRLRRKAFLAEAALVGRLQHPHIVEILDAATEPEYRYVVMEYIQGATLDDHCEISNLLPLGKVVEIAFKCIRALDYAFQMGVIHRDIKPGNLLLSVAGDVKVSDFGASFQEALNQETTQLAGVGSPAYMSPEAVRLEPLNHQTDIYSLGVVIYKLLTGRLPYNASNQLSLTYEILNVDPQPPSAYRPDLPAVLDDICMKAMAKSLDARYATWIDFGKELSRAFGALRSHGGAMSDSEKYNELRPMAFFTDFDDVVLWEALRISSWREIRPRAAIIREGETGDSIFMLVKGEAAVSLEGTRLNTLQSGSCFGEMLYFSDHTVQRTTTITAVTPATIMEIKARVLRASSDACQVAFQRAFMRVLIERLTAANRKLALGERAATAS